MATLTIDVAASSDDAAIELAQNSGAYQHTATLMGLPRPGIFTTNYGFGWRFPAVTVTNGSTINSAEIRLTKSGANWATVDWRWAVEQADDAATFSSGSPPGSRPVGTVVPETLNLSRTDATVNTFPDSTGNRTAFGASIKEVTDRTGWVSGNALVILQQVDSDPGAATTGNDNQPYATFDHATLAAPQLFIDYSPPIQHARPESDVSNAGAWTDQAAGTTNLYSTIDETTASTADYIASVSNPSSATVEVALGSLPDPTTNILHTYSFYARKPSSGAPLTIDAALYQGTTLIRTASFTLTTTFTQYDVTLTTTEADSITNYSDLRLRFTATQQAAITPTYVASGTAVFTATNNATMAPQAPATRAVGDSLFLIAHTSSNLDFNDAITGWTKVSSTENNTTAMHVELWRRTADGTSADNATVAGIASTAVRGARIFAVRDAIGAPTVGRNNNASSTTVTFPAATSSSAVSLSVLAYIYEDDPTAIGTVSGYSAFNVATSALGTGVAIGMNANRANSGTGSKTGGTAVVSGGTFAASPNVGLHVLYDGGSANVQAHIAWADFTTPLATSFGGNLVAAAQAGTAQSPNGIFALPYTFLAQAGTVTGTSDNAALSLGSRLIALAAGTTASSFASVLSGIQNLVFPAASLLTSSVLSSNATLSAASKLFASVESATGQTPDATIAYAQRFFSAVSAVTSASQTSVFSAGLGYPGAVSTATASSLNSLITYGSRLLGNAATVTASSPTSGFAYSWTMQAALLAASDIVDAAALNYAQRMFAATSTSTANAGSAPFTLGQRIFASLSTTDAATLSPATFNFAWVLPGAVDTASALSSTSTWNFAQRLFGVPATATADSLAITLQYAQHLYASLATSTAASSPVSFAFGWTMPGTLLAASDVVDAAAFNYGQHLFSALATATATQPDSNILTGIQYVASLATATASELNAALNFAFVLPVLTMTATGSSNDVLIGLSAQLFGQAGNATGSEPNAALSYAQRLFGVTVDSSATSFDAIMAYAQRFFSEVSSVTAASSPIQFVPTVTYPGNVSSATASSATSLLAGFARLFAQSGASSGTQPVGSWFSGLGFSAQPLLATTTVPNASLLYAYRLAMQTITATAAESNAVLSMGGSIPGVLSSASATQANAAISTAWKVFAGLAAATGQSWASALLSGIGFTASTMAVDDSFSPNSTLVPKTNFNASQGTSSAFSLPAILSTGLVLFGVPTIATGQLHDALLHAAARYFADRADASADILDSVYTVTSNVLFDAITYNVTGSLNSGAMLAAVYYGFISATIKMQKALTKLGVSNSFPGVLEYPLSFEPDIEAHHYADSAITARTDVEEE